MFAKAFKHSSIQALIFSIQAFDIRLSVRPLDCHGQTKFSSIICQARTVSISKTPNVTSVLKDRKLIYGIYIWGEEKIRNDCRIMFAFHKNMSERTSSKSLIEKQSNKCLSIIIKREAELGGAEGGNVVSGEKGFLAGEGVGSRYMTSYV